MISDDQLKQWEDSIKYWRLRDVKVKPNQVKIVLDELKHTRLRIGLAKKYLYPLRNKSSSLKKIWNHLDFSY